ncbi:MAG: hypothetical protein HY343_01510 [Lentisphaerae bacterium]|nr:hypothetical protein [Lentisphaerota bacterium]
MPSQAAVRWLVCGAYALGLAVVSLLPSRALDFAPPIPYLDKVAHGLLYAGMTGLLFWAVQVRRRPAPSGWTAGCIALAIAYGWFLEYAQQALCPGDRLYSIGDIAANAAGAIGAGAILYDVFRRRGARVDSGWSS